MMGLKKLMAVSFFLLLFIYPSAGQDADIILTDSSVKTDVHKKSRVILDEPRLSPEEAAALFSEGKAVPALDFGQPAIIFDRLRYWVSFSIHNNSTDTKEWALADYNRGVNFKEQLYILEQNKPVEYVRKTGESNDYWTLTIEPGTTKTYLYFIERMEYTIDIKLLKPGAFYKETVNSNMFFGFFIGVILLVTAYNLMLFFSFKDTSYIYFILFAFSFGIFFLFLNGIIKRYFPAALYLDYIGLNFRNMCMIGFALFARTFLQSKKYWPRTDRALMICTMLIALFSVLFILLGTKSYTILEYGISTIMLPLLVLIIIINVRALQNKYKPALYSMFGILLFILCLVLLAVSQFLIPIMPGFFNALLRWHIIDFTILAMIFLFSLGLTNRISLLKKQQQEDRRKAIVRKREKIESENYSRLLEKEKEEKTRFFVNLAHETKTPLTLIQNYFEKYIRNAGLTEDLVIIRDNIKKLQKDMINFLDVEKFEQGRIDYVHDRVFNFCSYLEQKTLLFKETAATKELTLTAALPEEKLYLKADPDALDRVVNNLLDNALKFTPAGGTIDISLTKKTDTTLELTVSDNGMGMDTEQAATIFQPFVQISRKKQSRQGIGMGLSIVKTVVNSMEGSIKVESEPGKGSTFVITLPRHTLSSGEKLMEFTPGKTGEIKEGLPVYHHKKPESIPFDPEKQTIMVVEDTEDLLYYLVSTLQDSYNVLYGYNGKEALALLEKNPLPELIISDMMMDEMDGLEFLKTVGANPAINDVPFIFLTAKTTLEDKLTGLTGGAVDYMFKPFSTDELKAKIKIHLQGRQRFYQKLKAKITAELKESAGEQQKGRDIETLFETKAKNANLTTREREILLLLLKAKEYKEIAWDLTISIDTVRYHIKNLYRKFNVRSKDEIYSIFMAA